MKRKPPSNEIVIIAPDAAAGELTDLLSHLNYDATAARTSRHALILLRQRPSAIVLIDVDAPDEQGPALLRAIRSGAPHNPVICISGRPTIAEAASYLEQGAYDVVAKPLATEHFDRLLRHALHQKALRDELQRRKRRNLMVALTLPLWALLGYGLMLLVQR